MPTPYGRIPDGFLLLVRQFVDATNAFLCVMCAALAFASGSGRHSIDDTFCGNLESTATSAVSVVPIGAFTRAWKGVPSVLIRVRILFLARSFHVARTRVIFGALARVCRGPFRMVTLQIVTPRGNRYMVDRDNATVVIVNHTARRRVTAAAENEGNIAEGVSCVFIRDALAGVFGHDGVNMQLDMVLIMRTLT